MIPVDATVVIDGVPAIGVDFTGIDPLIHAIQWYGDVGEVEYVTDYNGDPKPDNQEITSLAPYQSYVTQAQEIIYAAQNPQIFYSTSDSTEFQGESYPIGDPIVITTPNTPPPASTTSIIPPTPEDFQQLYWTGDSWVLSAFPISLSLLEAQANLTDQVEESAASNCNEQARIYSFYSLAVSADPGALTCADYSDTLSEYQADQDAKVQSQINSIQAATTVADLYSFNPTVNPVPL